jgi:hypothetical protein
MIGRIEWAGRGIADRWAGLANIRSELIKHWREAKQRLFMEPYLFREDELITAGKELDELKGAIGRFNDLIKLEVEAVNGGRVTSSDLRVRERLIKIYDLNAVFENARREGRLVPELGMTLDLRLKGGLFSMDGVHLGRLGHALIAQDFFKLMLQEARRRDSKTFGGLDITVLESSSVTFEETIRLKAGQDQVFRRFRGQ